MLMATGCQTGPEQTYGLDPFNGTGDNGPGGDPDGDGLQNCRSFTAGTPLTDPSSFPVLDNSWTNSASGFWHVGGNWSQGIPPSTNNLVYIINAGSKTVTIDIGTSGSMTISNLTVAGVAGAVNTLQLTNAGTVTPSRIPTP